MEVQSSYPALQQISGAAFGKEKKGVAPSPRIFFAPLNQWNGRYEQMCPSGLAAYTLKRFIVVTRPFRSGLGASAFQPLVPSESEILPHYTALGLPGSSCSRPGA